MLVARGVEDRREHPARPAPGRPPVDQRYPRLDDRVLECVLSQCDGTHPSPFCFAVPNNTHGGITRGRPRHSPVMSRPAPFPGGRTAALAWINPPRRVMTPRY